MTSSQDVYNALNEIVDEGISEMSISYTQNNSGNHLFNLYGKLTLYDDEFRKLAEFEEEFEPQGARIESGLKGAHIQFEFSKERFNTRPEPVTSYGRIEPRDAETGEITECSNCRKSTYGLHRPPANIMYPCEGEFGHSHVETHDLCVACSPGHFDDVTRKVKYFGVRDGSVVKIGWHGENNSVEWEDYEDVDNPFVETTVNVIESLIL